ncbi:MAG: site-2 protease family protein [Candidatus Saccharimonadales bacterium]
MNFDFASSNLIYIFVALVVAVTLHEAMHAFTSHWLGDDTAHAMGRVSLNPLKHVDPYTTILLPLVTLVLFKVPLLAAKPVPFNPSRVRFEEFGAALVGLAGPFTNLALAVLTAGVLRITDGAVNGVVLQFLIVFLQVNIGLFVFNMIPIPPLDGSRLIYALVPESVQELMASMERYGIMLIFALVLLVPAFSVLVISLNSYILHILL